MTETIFTKKIYGYAHCSSARINVPIGFAGRTALVVVLDEE